MKYFPKLNIFLFGFLMSLSLLCQRAFSEEMGDGFGEGALLGGVLGATAVLATGAIMANERDEKREQEEAEQAQKSAEQAKRQENLQKIEKLPPTLKALMYRDLEKAKELIRSGASDIRITEPNILVDGKTALYLATEIGDPDLILELIKQGAGETINVKNEEMGYNTGYTPLHLAVLTENMPALEALLSVDKINTNAKDHIGRTPLHLAILIKNMPALEALLSFDKANINSIDNYLYYAVDKRNFKAVQLLLKEGADPNAQQDNMTPLHNILREKPVGIEMGIAKNLIVHGANMNLEVRIQGVFRHPLEIWWRTSSSKEVVSFLREIQLENPKNEELLLATEERIKFFTTPFAKRFINGCLALFYNKGS